MAKGVIKKYLDLKADLEKLEKSIDFVYIFKAKKSEHAHQMVEKIQRDFLCGLGFSLVSHDETVVHSPAFKFAAPEEMEPGVVHNIRCKLLLIEKDIITNQFKSLDVYTVELT